MAPTTAPTVEPLGDDPGDVESLTTTQTAALIRAALKAAFPGVKFSVRSSTYSMGSAVDVSWTDGPATRAVETITDAYQGSSYDSMAECKTYVGPVKVTGAAGNVRRVRLGADSVHTHHDLSPEHAARFEPLAAEILGEPFDRDKVYDGAYPTRWGTWTAYTGGALIRWLADRVDPDNPDGDQDDETPAGPAAPRVVSLAALVGQTMPPAADVVAQAAPATAAQRAAQTTGGTCGCGEHGPATDNGVYMIKDAATRTHPSGKPCGWVGGPVDIDWTGYRSPVYMLGAGLTPSYASGKVPEIVGTVDREGARWVGRDTAGRVLFDVKDHAAAEVAICDGDMNRISSVWFGVQASAPHCMGCKTPMVLQDAGEAADTYGFAYVCPHRNAKAHICERVRVLEPAELAEARTVAAELDARSAGHLIGQWLPRPDGTAGQVADVERFRGALGGDDVTGVTYTDGTGERYLTRDLPAPVPAPEPTPATAEPVAEVVDLAARRAARNAAQADTEPAPVEPEPVDVAQVDAEPAPMRTVGDFRAALTFGSLWHVTDHRTPSAGGPRRITRNHGRTFDYTGTFTDGSPLVNGGQTYHPRAEECRVAGDRVDFISEDGRAVLVTWRRIDRPAGDPVPAEDVKPGAYAFAVGQSEYGDTMTVTGYIASAGRVKATRRRKRSGAREMVALYVTENPGGWNGWRTTVYVDLGVTVQPVAEPRAAVAQAAPKPAADAQEPAGDEPREDTPAQKWALIVQAGGFFDPSKRQHGRKGRAYVAMARVHGLPENPIPTTAQILAAQKADLRPDDYIRRAYLAEYGRMLADVPAAEVRPVDRIALPFAEAEASAQAEPERYAVGARVLVPNNATGRGEVTVGIVTGVNEYPGQDVPTIYDVHVIPTGVIPVSADDISAAPVPMPGQKWATSSGLVVTVTGPDPDPNYPPGLVTRCEELRGGVLLAPPAWRPVDESDPTGEPEPVAAAAATAEPTPAAQANAQPAGYPIVWVRQHGGKPDAQAELRQSKPGRAQVVYLASRTSAWVDPKRIVSTPDAPAEPARPPRVASLAALVAAHSVGAQA